MPFRAWRWAAATLLVVIAADVAATPDAVAATGTSQTRIQTTAGTQSAATKRTATRRRRARRGPPGGVVYARCAVVIDPLTGQVLFGKNADTAAPIASITKLMTAIVFLEQKPDLSRSVEVTREELYGGGHTQLRNKELVTLGDLLHMSLMCSDNVATRVLAREAGLSRWEFLAHMNQKADELGLTGTDFVEITGLDERNVSTAADVARLLRAASANDLIHSITTTSVYDFRSDRRPHRVVNTNRLLHSRYQVLGGKTGFISEAGYCVATWIRAEGHDLIAVVLGAPTNATRFADVVRMVQKTIAQGFAPSES
jgi:D-alanyl-D-alanine endopeptidase (penicillin-binding protein 7)